MEVEAAGPQAGGVPYACAVGAGFDEAGLLALNAGHVLLVRHPGEARWRIPRTDRVEAEDAGAAFGRLVSRLKIEVLSEEDLGIHEIDGRAFALRRARIPGLPEAPGHELRLVRLAYLPRELMAPDKPLLDALLSQG
ncbi:MAG: hypothetical protein NVS3B24_22950 [Candidatus Dormibacteria bacterium]